MQKPAKTSRFLVLFTVLWAAALTACAPVQPSKPIADAADATTSYVAAKRAYVDNLERAIRATDPVGSTFRLVAVTGPQWRIGEVVDIDNPLNAITEKCLFPADKLPKIPVPWSSLPGMTQSKRITFSAGLPESVLKFLGKDNKVGLNFDLAKTGQFSLSELQSIILVQDAFEAGLSDECKDILALRGGLVVRGVVNGKEIFKSGGQLDFGADLKILEDEILKLKYNNKGDFELEDKGLAPKMFMVAYFPKQTRGPSGVTSRSPTKDEVDRLEKLRLK